MTEVISVRFKNKGKVYFFDPAGIAVPTNAHVIVETSKGLEYAECTYGNHQVEDTAIIPPLRPVVRVATPEDDKKAADNKAKESEAFDFCQKKIAEHKLDMKLVDVEFGFEGGKILFFFTSDGRVDFRELVKDLASVFKTRIELRQIGVRDEARMLGGLGICGKPFCCEQFLDEFHPVSIKMAKTQGLSLNPVKISGTCGRLMCCLKYEENAYEDLVKKAPKVDAFVETPAGKGSVISVNLLRGNAKVRLEEGNDTTLKAFTFEELDVLGGKARRAEYIAAKAEGKLEEAGFKESAPREAAPPRETAAPRDFRSSSPREFSSPRDSAPREFAPRDTTSPRPESRPAPRNDYRPQEKREPAADGTPGRKQENPPKGEQRQNRPNPPAKQNTKPDKKPFPPRSGAGAPPSSQTQLQAAPGRKPQQQQQQNRNDKPADPQQAAQDNAGQANAAGKKPGKRHHRGGKGRNKPPKAAGDTAAPDTGA